ncbi:hypothetical protein PoB_005181800 [Plakobranchus ocellatus]|uniref:Transmembrane protein n=1 Tax=Plakobranchus ocellatus TaxID=259542 RepID=A0AAV4C0A2_9GAST|nr:hypothetical protein PoB_005181800 [Plakobranchus ocellatus]
MASFELSEVDLVKISLSAHVFLLLRALLGQLIDWLLPLLSSCTSTFRTLLGIHNRAPGLLPRVLTEQISLLVLVILDLLALSHTSVSLVPFGHQPQPSPSFLIRLVLSACAARYIVLASWLLLDRKSAKNKTGMESKEGELLPVSESGSRLLDILNALICGGTTLLCLGYHENFLLGMTLPFQELSSILTQYCQLREMLTPVKATCSTSCSMTARTVSLTSRCLTLLACTLCLVCRGGLPALFLVLALRRESPFVMNQVSLIWFFFSGACLAVFHAMLMYRAVLRVRHQIYYGMSGFRHKHNNRLCCCLPFSSRRGQEVNLDNNSAREAASARDRGGAGGRLAAVWDRGEATGTNNQPFISMDDHPDSSSNHTQQDISLAVRDINKYQLQNLLDLNCGLLRPCDNRNVSPCSYRMPKFTSSGGSVEAIDSGGRQNAEGSSDGVAATDKINVVRKKEITKTWLLYRLLTNSLSSSPSIPTSSPPPSPTQSFLASGKPVSSSPYDPWVFPALYDANIKKKLHSQSDVTSSYFPSASEDSTFLSKHPLYSGHTEEIPLQTHTGFEEFNELPSPKPSSVTEQSSKANLNDTPLTDLKVSKKRMSTFQTPKFQARRSRNQLTNDCVKLLGVSKESSLDSWSEMSEDFTAV